MLVELVTTGSELLLGEITNYNSAYLSKKLNEIGYSVIYHTTVGDNPQRMEEALKVALSRVDLVITTGGLGPTQGDMTKSSAPASWGCPSSMTTLLPSRSANGSASIMAARP